MPVRKPVVAGQFYESEPKMLNLQLNSCFTSKFGPGSLPSSKKSGRVFGCVCPHAGYQFSGPAAAFSYKALAESEFPSTFVVLAPNHTGYGSDVSTLSDDWETPLGVVKADKKFISSLMDRCDFVVEDPSAHMYEHSIEVQLPFLQFISGKHAKDLRFVPIVLGSSIETLRRLGEALASIDKDACFVASSDFTHYGHSYGYLPFRDDQKVNMYRMDKAAIDSVVSLDVDSFVAHIKRVKATICGYAPIITTMFAVKSLGCKRGRLLKYYTSGDVVNDYSSAVGYASIVFV
ncbi:MAG: AmmeMemoRadiSam system protein B [archaeon]